MSEQDKLPDKDKQLAEAQERAKKWEGLYTETTVKRALLDAAERGGAFHAPQLVPFLMKDAKMEEANGQFVIHVVTNENGKEVRRTPDEAVANMKKQSGHANLFKDTMAAKPTLAAPAARPKLAWKNHEEFLKIRAEHPEWLGLAPLPKRR